MAKKSYQVEYGPTWWECTISIDHTTETNSAIKSMVEFWEDWQQRLEINKGDYTKTFLAQLARKMHYLVAEDTMLSVSTLIQEFDNF